MPNDCIQPKIPSFNVGDKGAFGIGLRWRLAIGGLPVLFVVVWSSGFLVGGISTRTASPTALGFWRFALAAAVLGIVTILTRAPWPRRPSSWIHLLVAGVLLQTVQFAGSFIALSLGVSAGLTSLITCATPLVVAAVAVPVFGERLRRRQVIGLVVGLAGVAAAVASDLSGLGRGAGLLAAVAGLAGFAGGTLYQKRFGEHMDLRTGMFVQLLAATASIAPLAAFTGGFAIPFTVTAVASAVWLALVGSVGAFVLLFCSCGTVPGPAPPATCSLSHPSQPWLASRCLASRCPPARWPGSRWPQPVSCW